jgi:hypothetical protein
VANAAPGKRVEIADVRITGRVPDGNDEVELATSELHLKVVARLARL